MGKRKARSLQKKQIAENKTIFRALNILNQRMRKSPDITVTNPSDVKAYLRLRLEEREREIFAVMFFDHRHQLITYKELFFGTIDSCSVHPREVARIALKYNASAIIFAHNHPSGVAEPSDADQHITEKLKKALSLLEIRVLDHFVIGDGDIVSFAERGIL